MADRRRAPPARGTRGQAKSQAVRAEPGSLRTSQGRGTGSCPISLYGGPVCQKDLFVSEDRVPHSLPIRDTEGESAQSWGR